MTIHAEAVSVHTLKRLLRHVLVVENSLVRLELSLACSCFFLHDFERSSFLVYVLKRLMSALQNLLDAHTHTHHLIEIVLYAILFGVTRQSLFLMMMMRVANRELLRVRAIFRLNMSTFPS